MTTKYRPKSKLEYSQSDLTADFKGFIFDATQNAQTINDNIVPYDVLIDGAEVYISGGQIGDSISAQVVDINNVMGYGLNVVLGRYVTNWFIVPNQKSIVVSEYPAKIFSGLFLRLIYNNISLTSPAKVIVNYRLHRVLW